MPAPIWIDPNKAAIAVRKLSETLGLNAKGEVTLDWGADADNAIDLLSSLFRFSDEVPRNVRYHSARCAVIEARKANALAMTEVAIRIVRSRPITSANLLRLTYS